MDLRYAKTDLVAAVALAFTGALRVGAWVALPIPGHILFDRHTAPLWKPQLPLSVEHKFNLDEPIMQ
jgi:hypothetical protein